jgi:hypothetical protein
MEIKIKIKTLALLIVALAVLLTTTAYIQLRFTSPVVDIKFERSVTQPPEIESNINKSLPAQEPSVGNSQAINLSRAYQSESTKKIYIVSQAEKRIKLFERHPVYGDILVGEGIIEELEFITSFFSTEAYGNTEQVSGELRLRLQESDGSLRGGFFINGEKKQKVVLLPV